MKHTSGIIEISHTDQVSQMKPYLHAHPGVQFVWLETFSGTFQAGEQISPAAETDLCMIGEQMPHRLISSTSRVQATNLLVDKAYLDELLPHSSSPALLNKKVPYLLWNLKTAQSEKVVHLYKQKGSGMNRLINVMRQAGSGPEEERPERMDRMMTEFVTNLLWAVPERNVKRFQTVQEVSRYLEENLTKPFVLEELAAEFGYHKSHLCRMFKEVQQESMYEYAARARCLLAAQQMEESSRSITEISQGVGFSDYNQFAKYFKRYMGEIPAVWRKNRKAAD